MRKGILGLLLVALVAVAAIAGLTTTQTASTATTSGTMPATSSPADGYISAGKYYLQLHKIIPARDQFKLAVQADPANQEANFLYGVTRVFALYEASQAPSTGLDSVKEILTLSGFTFDTFGLYGTTLASGPETLPDTTPRTGAVLDFLRTNMLPEVEGAIGNLAAVNSTGFTSVISPTYLKTTGANLTVDYADAVVVKSLLYALQANINLMLAYNLDVNLPDIQSGPDQLMTYKLLLMQDSTFLTVKDAARLGTAKTALVNFIDTYMKAAPALLARAGNPYHLFVVDTDTTDEPVGIRSSNLNDITDKLAELKTALSGPHTFSFPDQSLAVDLSKFLNSASPLNLRALFGDCASGTSFPDRTFGGLFPNSVPGMDKVVTEAGPHLLGVFCSDANFNRPLMQVESPDYFYSSPYYPATPSAITISNHGTGDLKVTNVSLSGPNLADFILTGGTCGSMTPTLFPGQSCDLSLSLSSTANGMLLADLKIESNDVIKPVFDTLVQGWVQGPAGGTITGVVKDADTKAILSSGGYVEAVPVSVWPFGGSSGYGWADSWGSFTITGAPVGSYKLRFHSYDNQHATTWYNKKSDQASADVVVLGSSNLNVGDFLIYKGGSITGRLTTSSGTGVSYSPVRVYSSTQTQLPWGYLEPVQWAQTDGNGYYSVSGLPTGSYKIQFDSTDQGYPSQYYGGSANLAGATAVSVTAPNTTSGVDAVVVSGGSISGSVTDATGAPAFFMVYLYQDGDAYPTTSEGGANGYYSFSHVMPGKYKLEFLADGVDKFYNGKQDLASADTVTVTSGNNTTANMTLGTGSATMSWGNIYRVTKADGTTYDQVDAGINTSASTLAGMTLTVTGPNGFSYTYTDADRTPYLPNRGLSLTKTYPSTTPLATGVYTFTLDDGHGNITHRVNRKVAVSKNLPLVDSSTIQYQRKADGSYRISWAPVKDTQTYYYRLRLEDSTGNPVYFGTPDMATSSDVPPAVMTNGSSYRVRIEAFDGATTGVATLRSNSAYVYFVPQESDYDPNRLLLSYADAYNLTDAAGNKSFSFGFGFASAAEAQKVTAATVTGPNGFSYSYQIPADVNGFDIYKSGTTFNVTPVPGLYSFTITANGIQHKAYATLTSPVSYPAPDPATYQAEEQADGTIRFSWANVNHTGALYYRVQVTDNITGATINSGRVNQTFTSIPKTTVGDFSTKKWRVEVHDSSNIGSLRNRTNGPWTSAPLNPQLFEAARPVIGSFRLRNTTDSAGKSYAQVAVTASAASSTLASIVVTGPGGYSRDLLAAGRYSPDLSGYTLQEPGTFAAGLYTLTVKDNFGRTATRYSYKPAPHAMPQVDFRTFRTDRESNGNVRLSFAPVATDVPVWYEVDLYSFVDADGDGVMQRTAVKQNYANVTNAGIYPLTSVSIPEPAEGYVVVRAFDGSNYSTIDNISSSVVTVLSAGRDYASLIDGDTDGYASDTDISDSDQAAYPHSGGNDSLPAAVVTTTPGTGWPPVPTNFNISATFNKVIDQRTLPGSFTLDNGVTGSVSYNPQTKTANFIPAQPLQTGTTYTATISTALKDQAGNALSTPYSWSFMTAGAPPVYSFSTTISGYGTVNEISGGSFACASGTCTQSYNLGTGLLLHATPGAGFQFAGWTGACAAFGTNDCTLEIGSNQSVGANFVSLPFIRIGTSYFGELRDAIGAAVMGSVIESVARAFTDGNLVFNRPGVAVRIQGGFNDTFSTLTGYTYIDGKLSISGGTLRVNRLKIM